MGFAVKVYKKLSPNGKLTVYVNKRDIVDHISFIDPIDGVVVADKEYLADKQIYVEVVAIFRYGHEEDETMGLKFKKEITVMHQTPEESIGDETYSVVQDKLLDRFGDSAKAFTATVPQAAPPSVTLQSGHRNRKKPLGVEYELRVYAANSKEEKRRRKGSVTLAIRKVQFYIPIVRHRPHMDADKSFALSQGKLRLECNLERDVYYHGDSVGASVIVQNDSNRTVKTIRLEVMQNCEVTMIHSQYSRAVAQMVTKEGCPITPGVVYTREFSLKPTAQANEKKIGLALDGRIKDEDVNLASSTVIEKDKSPSSMCGIVVSYSMKITLNCGALHGELVAEIPFKLLHPPLGRLSFAEQQSAKAQCLDDQLIPSTTLQSGESLNSGNIEFEEFKRSRSMDDLQED